MLHFIDNASFDQGMSGMLFKSSQSLKGVRQPCLRLSPEENHSEDEQIIPTIEFCNTIQP